MKTAKKIVTIGGVAGMIGACFVTGATAFAQSVVLTDPLGGKTLPQVINNVTHFLSTAIAIPLATIMVLIGAFQMTTSAGNSEKYTKGKNTLIWAAIGFAVAVLASGVTTLITNILSGS